MRECGRSMVEMLGVLAIIGVLSVGAIAGYSKAMFKYKLNKQAQSLNLLLNNLIQIKPSLEYAYTGTAFNIDLFQKLNLIPDGFTDTMQDVFGYIYHASYSSAHYYVQILLEQSGNKLSNESQEICRNILTTLKENANQIKAVEVRSDDENATNGHYTSYTFYGELSRNQKKLRYLSQATLEQINAACDSCYSETRCSIVVYL